VEIFDGGVRRGTRSGSIFAAARAGQGELRVLWHGRDQVSDVVKDESSRDDPEVADVRERRK